MSKPYPQDERQLLILKEISKNDQAWVVLWFVLGTVAALTIALLYCIFGHLTSTLTAISALLDGLFGFCLRAIIKFHFPSPLKESSTSDKDLGPVSTFLSKL